VDLLRLPLNSRSDRDIADVRVFGPRTVQTRISMPLAKLGVSNRAEAAAVRFGLGSSEMACKKPSSWPKGGEYEGDHGDPDHRLAAGGPFLVVIAPPHVAPQPGEGPSRVLAAIGGGGRPGNAAQPCRAQKLSPGGWEAEVLIPDEPLGKGV